jgi:hypothetical protein
MQGLVRTMDSASLTRYRWPIAAVLVAVAVFVFWPRGPEEIRSSATPAPSIEVGAIGGEVATPSPSVVTTPIPTLTPNATPSPAPTATAQPQADAFAAEVLACRSISGDACRGQLGTLPANAGAFTALVRFAAATAGDQLNAVLTGPGGTVAGFPYTLQGGGNGYYYSQFQVGNLPPGDYTLTATRNGDEVATTTFRKDGG